MSSLQTLESMDSMLEVLVLKSATSSLLELQHILQVWHLQRVGFPGPLLELRGK